MLPIYKYEQSSMFASKIDRDGRCMLNSMTTVGGAITHSVDSTKNINLLHGVHPFKSPSGGFEPDTQEDEEDDYFE